MIAPVGAIIIAFWYFSFHFIVISEIIANFAAINNN
jgi:hypothetical protein